MKLTLGELRKIIREDIYDLATVIDASYARGIPQYVLEQASELFVNELKRHVERHVSIVAKSPNERREMMETAGDSLKNLKQRASELAREALWRFDLNR